MRFKQTAACVSRVSDFARLGETPSGAVVFEVKGIPDSAVSRMNRFWLPLVAKKYVFEWSEICSQVS